jgi:hypothetical protein
VAITKASAAYLENLTTYKMSDLLNQASLVMVPSGYKEDTVYSVVPSDGSGDLAFTRASNGTRINSAGLVEDVPWNLLEYSEEFTNAAWVLACTIGANATTAPNGTTTADSFTSAATLANHVAYQFATGVGGAYTYSVYVKKVNSSYVYIKLVGDSAQWVAAVFDLNDGTLTKSEASGWTGLTASSESVGNGWYRLIVSGSGATSANFNVGIQYTNTGTPTFSAYADAFFTGTGTIDYYIWGAQLNIGSTAKPYFPTTDRLNVPRLTYQNGGGGCPSLLLEKQSTNYITYSEQFDNAAWTKNGVSITANDTTSPDGTQNADKLTSNDPSGSVYRIYEANAIPSDSVCSVSVYFKYDNWQYAFIVGDNYSGAGKFVVFDLINGTNTFVSSGYTATISSVGSGWYKCTMTGEMGITAYCQFGLAPTSTAYNSISIANGKNLYVWGTQREVSSYPTSYIPTTSSSATRVADICKRTISSFVGTNKGTFFWQGITPSYSGANDYVFDLSDLTNFNLNRIALYTATGSTDTFQFYTSVTGGANVTLANNTFAKIAVVWNGTSSSLYINGALAISNQTISNSNPTSMHLNTRYTEGDNGITKVGEVVLFNTNLTNTELIALTTL